LLLGSAGVLLVLLAVWSAFQPGLKHFSASLSATPTETSGA
jgi:hypothetical protein